MNDSAEKVISMTAGEYEKMVKRGMTFSQAAKGVFALIAFLFVGGWSASSAISDYATKSDVKELMLDPGDQKARQDARNLGISLQQISENVEKLSENQLRNEKNNELNYYRTKHTEELMIWYADGRKRSERPKKDPRHQALEAELTK